MPAGAAKDVFACLQRHPQLCVQVAALLDQVENRVGALNTGDEAETAIVERMRQFGRDALSGRDEGRHAGVQPEPAPRVRKVGKKTLLLTTLGPITLLEQLWRRASHTRRPFRAAAQVRARGNSRQLSRALTDFGVDDAFAAAAAKV
jgi:uncharacterized protein HemY